MKEDSLAGRFDTGVNSSCYEHPTEKFHHSEPVTCLMVHLNWMVLIHVVMVAREDVYLNLIAVIWDQLVSVLGIHDLALTAL